MQRRHPITRKNVYRRATCPYCFGPLIQVVTGDEPGEHFEFTVCGGPCKAEFLPPWPEHQWSEPGSRPIPHELAIIFDDDLAAVEENVLISSVSA